MRALIVRFLLWLVEKIAPPEPVSAPDPFLIRVAELVRAYDALAATGEYKRHAVYARLIKDFPEKEHSDIAYAIEKVIQHVRRSA